MTMHIFKIHSTKPPWLNQKSKFPSDTFWYNSWNIELKWFILNVMHAEFSYAHFEWSFCAIYYYFHNQNTSIVEQGAWKKIGTFVQWGYQALHCVHAVLCRYFNVILKKICNFFSCTWVHKFRDFTIQWWV